ncbi:MAG TPA: phenylalanine--tRNA ligase subunit beta [Pyrinomonadaceae bacterium]|nr:phenylalanine--tRNA ligase subunit beta [Pyrinomonadaceae bacterium]
MLISYNWLRELTNTKLTPLELRNRLTMVGLAIDAVIEVNGDAVLDVEVPSNRPDCLSHIGIAREVSVIESGSVTQPDSKPPKTEGRAADFTDVEIQDADLCPRYSARIVRGVTIAPSPEWLAKRLEEIGQRPINNIADITNYVLHESGQPLHAFDLAKLAEHRIVVRRARRGEQLRTLDGIDRSLEPEMLVIADAEKPVALAGIMGGEDSEISQSTVDVLIESAYFNPDSVRRTARKLGMDTEASRRFERGADPENVLRAQARCVELICEIAGGSATEDAIDVNPLPLERREVRFRPSRVAALTSIEVPTTQIFGVLEKLGFVTRESGAGETLTYEVPSWRVDVALEEDLVEEVARHVGYARIGSELPPAKGAGEYQPTETKQRALRRALVAAGFDEAINFSFITSGVEESFELLPELTITGGFATLRNPIVEDAAEMRPTLLPGLLNSLRHNFNQGLREVRLFEIGRVFGGIGDGELPDERLAWALVATGGALKEAEAQASRDIDFFDLRGAIEAAVDSMRLAPLTLSPASVKHLREGQSAKITTANGTNIGSMGRLAEYLAGSYKLRQPVYVAELDLTLLLGSPERKVHYRPLSRFPSVVRDVTLLVDRQLTLAELMKAIENLRSADLRGARLVGTYEGSNIPDEKRSITLRIEYRAEERTLRDDEVEEQHRALVSALAEKFHAQQH